MEDYIIGYVEIENTEIEDWIEAEVELEWATVPPSGVIIQKSLVV